MNRTALVSTLLCAAVVAALGGCRSTSQPAEQAAARQRAEQENAAQAKAASADAAAASATLDRIEVTGSRMQDAYAPSVAPAPPPAPMMLMRVAPMQPANTEKYAQRTDNPVQRAAEQPVSTFSIDVDTGSYANVRRMLNDGVRPPSDAVRAEEFINYFDYGHPAPLSRETPFRVTTELATAPWNPQRQVLMIVDVPYGRVDRIRDAVALRHPEVLVAAQESRYPAFP